MSTPGYYNRILIIEDDFVTAFSLATIAKYFGYTPIDIATSRNEAVALAVQNPPALILSDLHLQRPQDGAEAVEAILAMRSVPVAFITGTPDAVPRTPCLKEAVVIAKPFHPSEIGRFLTTALPLSSLDPPRSGYPSAEDRLVTWPGYGMMGSVPMAIPRAVPVAIQRIEVITGPERRRQFTDAEKLRLVEEALQPGARAPEVARQQDVGVSLLYRWRKLTVVPATITLAEHVSTAHAGFHRNQGDPETSQLGCRAIPHHSVSRPGHKAVFGGGIRTDWCSALFISGS